MAELAVDMLNVVVFLMFLLLSVLLSYVLAVALIWPLHSFCKWLFKPTPFAEPEDKKEI